MLSVIEAGLSTSDVAEQFHISQHWVQTLVALYRASGTYTVVIDLATGEILAEHTIDLERGYQPQRKRPR